MLRHTDTDTDTDADADAAADAGSDTGGSGERATAVCELWSLRRDVLIESGAPDGTITLVGRWGETAIRSAGPRLRELLARMRLGPIRLESVLDDEHLSPAGTVGERAALMLALARLQHSVVRHLATADGSNVLLAVEPIARDAEFRPGPVHPDRPVRLSSFAVLRMQDGVLQAESPLALHRVRLHDPETAMIVSALAQPQPPAALSTRLSLPAELVRAAVSYLCAAGIAVQGTPAQGGFIFAEDDDPVLRMWSSADLLFHARCTTGRHDGDHGATYPFGSGPCPEPAVKPRPAQGRIPLYRPKLDDLLETDAPFTAVFEARRSANRFGSGPPTVRELGELLYRALRVRARITTTDDSDPEDGCLLDRPYPAGGAVHELEFYLTVHDCQGLDPGVYAYDPLAHELVRITGEERVRRALQSDAEAATGLELPPPVLITITARFARVFWKYSGMGYALVLKDTGVALTALQLVATAMNLATCPVGGVEVGRTPGLLGLDWRAESGVGALVLGRAPDPDREHSRPGVRHGANDPHWQETGQRRVRGAR